jgi:hypothetical protein
MVPKRVTDAIAEKAWRNDGEPDGNCPGEVNAASYRSWAEVIVVAAEELGYDLVARSQLTGLGRRSA